MFHNKLQSKTHQCWDMSYFKTPFLECAVGLMMISEIVVPIYWIHISLVWQKNVWTFIVECGDFDKIYVIIGLRVQNKSHLTDDDTSWTWTVPFCDIYSFQWLGVCWSLLILGILSIFDSIVLAYQRINSMIALANVMENGTSKDILCSFDNISYTGHRSTT